MRKLVESEKDLISRIIKQDTFHFRDLFSDTLLDNASFTVHFESKEIDLYYSHNTVKIRDVLKELVLIIGLIKLLEKYDFLLRLQVEVEMQDQITIGRFQGGRQFLFGDKNLKTEIATSILTEFIVTQELKSFVDNKFRTVETIRHEQTMRVSWAAIVLALLTSLYSILAPSEEYKSDFKTLEGEVKKTNNALDSIRFELIELKLRRNTKLDSAKRR